MNRREFFAAATGGCLIRDAHPAQSTKSKPTPLVPGETRNYNQYTINLAAAPDNVPLIIFKWRGEEIEWKASKIWHVIEFLNLR